MTVWGLTVIPSYTLWVFFKLNRWDLDPFYPFQISDEQISYSFYFRMLSNVTFLLFDGGKENQSAKLYAAHNTVW